MKPEDFVRESNKIEGITRWPTTEEVDEFNRFMALKKIDIPELQNFVDVYQPGAVLRDKLGLDVRVGNHIPPPGGPNIREELENLLSELNATHPYKTHIRYETIHPFTDGNGRSGRMLWAWRMQDFPLGFLHHFYYQTLQHNSKL